VTYYGKLELLAAMGSWSCWQLGNDDLLQCVMFVLNHIVWVGYWLAPQKSLFGPSLSYPFLYLNSFSSYLRGRSPAFVSKEKKKKLDFTTAFDIVSWDCLYLHGSMGKLRVTGVN